MNASRTQAATAASTPAKSAALRPLKGVRVLSVALNLPGPAALMRLAAMGARCTKLEPPAPAGAASGDPMGQYNPKAYATLHDSAAVKSADLKTAAGQKMLATLLVRTDVLLTSFRPSAMAKLGLAWGDLKRAYPALSLVSIVGSPGARAEEPGHDLTYLAEHDLVTGLHLPPTLYADMGGALMASEAVLQAVLAQRTSASGRGVRLEVALSEAAAWLALPRHWGLTLPRGAVGGAHAGYKVYACADGRVAVAALEPHFAQALAQVSGLPSGDLRAMLAPATAQALATFFASQTRAVLNDLARTHALPLHTLPA